MKTIQIFETGKLFEEVQMKSIFPDGKTFPDCIPNGDLATIVNEYESGRHLANFDLRIFVEQKFDEPSAYTHNYVSSTTTPIERHIESLWEVLTRTPEEAKGSLLALPYHYIVPGGRFREIYYWDSYFTMLGLQQSGRPEMIRNMVDNFSFLIDQVGYIPNGNRTYFLGRSQPPFYSLMVGLLRTEKGDTELSKYRPQLEKEYSFWMSGQQGLNDRNPAIARVVKMSDGSILNRFWDKHDTPRPEAFKEDVELARKSAQDPPSLFRHLRAAAESGWDFSSRWFKDVDAFESIHTTDIIPVDLNCLLYNLEIILSMAFKIDGDASRSEAFELLARKRKEAIHKYCWDENQKFYFDYDFVLNKMTPHFTLAGAFPLFFQLATPAQAQSVASVLESKFLKPGGLSTTLHRTGQQWDAPNGWAPLQWITYKGLMNYQVVELAEKVRQRWMNANQKVYNNTGKMTEKYDVWNENAEASGGEYPNQDGFGWTNGVYLAMAARNKTAS